MSIQFIALAICFFLSACFSASEVALSSCNMLLLMRNATREKPSAIDRTAYEVAGNFKNYLPIILRGNNLANTAIATLSTQMTYAALPRESANLSWLGTALSTLILIVFCETIPKIIARSKSISVSRAVCIPIRCMYLILSPLAYVINLFFKIAGGNHENTDEKENIDSDEIALAVGEIRENGAIDSQEEELLVNSIDFDDTTVFEIATHRMDIDGIDIGDEAAKVLETASKTRYSRLIVYRKSRDYILGVIFAKSILKFFIKNQKPTRSQVKTMIEKEMFSPLRIHMTMDLNDCLSLMKKEKKHMAVINDEYGGTYGIITMEDILENISGEIWDESDRIENDVKKKNDDLYYIKGDLEIENMLDELDVANGEEYARQIESTSIGGLAFEMLDRLPRKGDSFEFAGFSFLVYKMNGRRVALLRAKRLH